VPVDPALPAVNVHPSLLPDGRGPAPVQWILSTHPDAAGVTIHKLTAEADAGDILAQEPMTLTAADDLHTVFARTYWRSAQMMAAILSDFPRAWAAAAPQSGTGRWTADHPEVFTIGAATQVGEALHHWRAFGPGLVAWDGVDQGGPDRNTHRTRWVAAVRGWREPHGLVPGTVASDDGRITMLAVADGFLLIEADTPEYARTLAEGAVFNELANAARQVAHRVEVISATNARRIGPVDHSRDGVFLFNWFYADSQTQNLAVWEYTAGWFEDQTGLDNSTLMLPDPGNSEYTVVNHCRWDHLHEILPSLIFKPSFRSYVLDNFAANDTAAMPILYRLA